MASRTLFLVCNAHLDPVWLWPWEEGLAETLATFRAAARFCETFDGFVFNHNEALLYQWVDAHEPALFERIRDLVRQGRWHIMGGWYLQPDCNLPSGESLVRQILEGKRYFQEKFQVEPRVAVNLDPFGHTRGLVQILKKSGYTGYLFCRPDASGLPLPAEDFVWTGYDGSEVVAHRAPDHYNSERGRARVRIERWLEAHPDRSTGLLLWGIGNHGGGPSHEDLTQIARLMAEETGCAIRHGTPEDYFAELDADRDRLPRVARDLNPWAVGCYTSMALVKQKHRRLENACFLTETMATQALLAGILDDPTGALQKAREDLLFCEFHDALPGTSIPEVEAHALARMDHGLTILSRLRTRVFFALLSGHAPPAEGEFPLFVYNPHPFSVEETVVCEFQPPEPNFDPNRFLLPELRDEHGASVPYQLEKESANLRLDQRKRLVFRGTLAPSTMTRFSCYLREVEVPDEPEQSEPDSLVLSNDVCEVVINRETGLMDRYRVSGIDYLAPAAFQPRVMRDDADPWGMRVQSYRDQEGVFSLLGPEESARFAGVNQPALDPVRVIEQGPIRTVVEALFHHHRSTLCVRYKIPSTGSEVEVEVRVFWMEKDRMLKLAVPTTFADGTCKGEVAYGVETFTREGEEQAAHRWLAVNSGQGRHALTVINDGTHGFDFRSGELGLSLLRSPAYSGHPVREDQPIVRQDRFEPRMDQGERCFRFWIQAGPAAARLEAVDREATLRNSATLALCCHPPGTGSRVPPGLSLSDRVVRLAALKMAEEGNRLIVRLFEPTGTERTTTVRIPALDLEIPVSLGAHEIQTLAVDLPTRKVSTVDLLERPWHGG